jgi:hypothetical protein
MTTLLDSQPFAARDDEVFLREMNELSRWHLEGCSSYRRVWRDFQSAKRVEDLPFLHVGVFKRQVWKTEAPDLHHRRTLLSSSTTGTSPSRIVLDERSSLLQSQSTVAIFKDLLGEEARPLVVLDDSGSLRRRGEASARITAAMSLAPLAVEIQFVLKNSEDPASMRWDLLDSILQRHSNLLFYGFTWMLWQAWGNAKVPDELRENLRRTKVAFVHSGGWKKLEAARVTRTQFDEALLAKVGSGSKVIDYYGLVEQVGVIFPLCEAGYRHVPRWAGVLVRDPWTLASLPTGPGLLQFMNILSWGSPYHSVLTEDVGQIAAGPCPCGRVGQRFELLGRVPNAEVRGCANV